MTVEVRPATRADIDDWYGSDYKRSCRAWVIDYDGQPACLAGYSFEDGHIMIFSDMRDHGASKMTVWRTARAWFEDIKKYNMPMVCFADTRIPRAGSFLKRLGFIQSGTSDFGDLYIWHPQYPL